MRPTGGSSRPCSPMWGPKSRSALYLHSRGHRFAGVGRRESAIANVARSHMSGIDDADIRRAVGAEKAGNASQAVPKVDWFLLAS